MGIFNIIWFIFFFGWLQSLVFLVLAAIFAATIVGYPLAKSMMEMAKLSAFPFGKEVIKETELKGTQNISTIRKIGGAIVNIVWFPIGLILAIIFIFFGILAFISILGIPVGIVYVRTAKFLISPVGAKVVNKKEAYAAAVANELEKRATT